MKSKKTKLALFLSIVGMLLIVLCFASQANAVTPPFNDNFANASAISGSTGNEVSTNVDATKQTGEPSHAGNVGGKSIWFKWTPQNSYSMEFHTQDAATTVDTLLAIYTGTSVNNLTLIAGRDDYGNSTRSRVIFPALAGHEYYIAIDGYNGAAGSITLTWSKNRITHHGSHFNISKIDDIAVFRPSNGTWYAQFSSNNAFFTQQFGASNDIPVPADYDGDDKTDVTVFRPANGTWYVTFSSDPGSVFIQPFGANGDIPTPGDYTADGVGELAVYRPSNGTWYLYDIFSGSYTVQQFGQSGDKPAQADYDGDGKVDVAVFRPSNGTWYILNSRDNSFRAVQWGQAGDIPVPSDYGSVSSDGKADIAVFRPSNGTWYMLLSNNNNLLSVQWGANGDIPQPMDIYTSTNNFGSTDYVVFRPSNGTWYMQESFSGTTRSVQFGGAGDKPISAAYVIQP